MNRHSRHQENGRCIARDTQCDHRNDSTTDAGIVRNLGCPDTFIDTGSKLLRMLAHLLRLTIRNQVGNSGSHARKETDPKTDEKRYDDHLQIILKVFEAEAEAFQ